MEETCINCKHRFCENMQEPLCDKNDLTPCLDVLDECDGNCKDFEPKVYTVVGKGCYCDLPNTRLVEVKE